MFTLKKLFVIISLFVSFSAFSEIYVKSFRKLESDMTARIDAPKKDQNGDVCAIIKVVTTQTGFIWEPDGLGILSAENKGGEYWLYVPYGAKRLTIKHPQLGVLRDYFYTLPIEKATVYEMVLISGRVETTVVEEIPKQWLVITPNPDKAMIYIDDNFVSKGEYQAQRTPGTYKYRIEAPLYHTDAGIIEITDEKKVLKVNLKPAFGYLNINTTPEAGATIIIDGKELQKTSPATTEAIASGEHTVQVIKEMYQPIAQKVTVSDNQYTNLDFTLIPNFGELDITTSKIAKILINGQLKGVGKWNGRLSAGIYTVEAQLDNHLTAKQDIDLKVGDLKTIELTPTPIYGTLDVITSPSGAIISINGIEYGTTPNTIKDILPGEYSISLKKDLFDPILKKVIIEANKKTVLNEPLPFGVQVDFESNPSDIELFIDNIHIGKTPLSINLNDGKHIVNLVNGDNIKVDTINIYKGCIKTFKYDLKYKKTAITKPLDFEAKIDFESKPSNIYLYIDNVKIGKTPISMNLKNGKHVVNLINENITTIDTIEICEKCKKAYNYDLSYEITSETLTKKTIIRPFYKDYSIAFTYGYHETNFLNDIFSNRITDGSIKKEFGQAVTVNGILYPIELSITAFISKFTLHNIEPFINSANIFHRGIDMSIHIIPVSIGRHIIPYLGIGYQISDLYTANDNTTIGNEIINKISLPVYTGGLKLKFGQFMLFGEYNRTFILSSTSDISEYKSVQLKGGIGIIF